MGVIIRVCHIPEEMHGLFRLRAVLVHPPGRPAQQGGCLAADTLWQAHGVPVLVHLSGHLLAEPYHIHACAQVHPGFAVYKGPYGVLRPHIQLQHLLVGLRGVLSGFQGEDGAAVGLVVPEGRVGDAPLAHPAPEQGVEEIGLYGFVYGQPPFVTKLLPGHEKTVPDVYRRFLLLVVVQIVLVEPVPAVVEHYLVVAKGEGVDIVPAHKAHYKACGV